MSAPATPKLQFHLSSAIVLMLAASVVLGINLHGHPTLRFIDNWDTHGYFQYEQGWPLALNATSRAAWAVDICFWILALFVCWYFAERRFRPGRANLSGEWIRLAMFFAIVCLVGSANLFPTFKNWNEWCHQWFVQGWPAMSRIEVLEGNRNDNTSVEWIRAATLVNGLAGAIIAASVFPIYRYAVHPIATRLRITHRFSRASRAVVLICAAFLIPLSVSLSKRTRFESATTSEVLEHRFVRREWGWPVRAQTIVTHELWMGGERLKHEIVTPERTWLRSIPITEAKRIIAGVTDDSVPNALIYNSLIIATLAIACGWIFEITLMLYRKLRSTQPPDL